MHKDNTNSYSVAASVIYNRGSNSHKQRILQYFSSKEKKLIEQNILYIHDSEYFDTTLNCCAIALHDIFKDRFTVNGVKLKSPTNIFELFAQLNIFVVNIENEISGGLTLVNFDQELEKLLVSLKIPIPSRGELYHHIKSFFYQINLSNSRFGCQSPYITLSIGIVENTQAATICETILKVMQDGVDGKPYIFPNITFRVKNGINRNKCDRFYWLFQESLKTTSIQMNPTYILADSKLNQKINPLDLHVVGCRSRLLRTLKDDCKTGIGRTNVGAVSVNLPRIGMVSKNYDEFYDHLKKAMTVAVEILIKKQQILKDIGLKNSPILINNNLLYPFTSSIKDILDEASLSIGFIGGYELSEIMMEEKTIQERYIFLYEVLDFMHHYCLSLSEKFKKIVTLIGVSGENLSYHFAHQDKEKNNNFKRVFDKGYYTNSFHIPVNMMIDILKKLSIEGLCHKHCDGGCISYLEISHNKNNIEGFEDIVDYAIQQNIHYLGFNFQKDLCNECGSNVVKDCCEKCGSLDILKIRRVSGYLGYLNSFSKGKKLEEAIRIKHTDVQY